MVSGSTIWRYRCWEGSKEVRLSIGKYPSITLKEAKERRNKIQQNKEHGVAPQETLTPPQPVEVVTFEKIARDWFAQNVGGWAENHAVKVRYRMERFLIAALGQRPIAEIKEPELLALLRAVETDGRLEAAKRIRQIAGMIFRYGVGLDVCERDVSWSLRGLLKAPGTPKHYGCMTKVDDIAGLLRSIDSYQGSAVTKAALLFSAHTFARPGEVRKAEWSEIDFERAIWKIPEDKMKKKRTHMVPLTRQSIEILQKLKPLTGHGQYIFPCDRNLRGDRPMSDNAVNSALRRMGYGKDEATAHGFRSTASTILNESSLWDGDLVELQLAHAERNAVRAAYNHAEKLNERRKMMEWWSNWLDSLPQSKECGLEIGASHEGNEAAALESRSKL
jgi:integrase